MEKRPLGQVCATFGPDAAHKLGALHEYKGETLREYTNIDGSFESGNPTEAGWQMMRMVGGWTEVGGYQNVYLDTKAGANGTKQSLAMTFKLGSQRTPQFSNIWIMAVLANQIHRDLAGFKGVKFYVKGSDDFTFQLAMRLTSKMQKESETITRNWLTNFPVTKEWKEIRIPFSSLSPGGGAQQKKESRQPLFL